MSTIENKIINPYHTPQETTQFLMSLRIGDILHIKHYDTIEKMSVIRETLSNRKKASILVKKQHLKATFHLVECDGYITVVWSFSVGGVCCDWSDWLVERDGVILPAPQNLLPSLPAHQNLLLSTPRKRGRPPKSFCKN